MGKGYYVNREGRTIVFLTFWQWLKHQKDRDDPVGDLSRDAIADRCHKGNTPDWWVNHLLDRPYACAFEAVRRAWDEYDHLDYS